MTNGDLEISLLFSHNEHIPTPILLTIYGLSYLFSQLIKDYQYVKYLAYPQI